METVHWAVWVGMVTGVIGAITGIAGSILGYVGYQRSNQLKSLDLRLELRRAVTNLFVSYSGLPGLIDRANRSHEAIMNARGLFGSGAMELWKRELEKDNKTVAQLSLVVPKPEVNHLKLTAEQLETKVGEIHALEVAVNLLMEKYNSSLASDDRERNNLRAEQIANR